MRLESSIRFFGKTALFPNFLALYLYESLPFFQIRNAYPRCPWIGWFLQYYHLYALQTEGIFFNYYYFGMRANGT